MADLYDEIAEEEECLLPKYQRKYWDRKTYKSLEEQQSAIKQSSTLYIGNLSFYTSENQLCELFSRVGTIKRVIMGLDRFKKTPCGFCFVEYYSHAEALACSNFLTGTKLDNRVIRCEMDGGFTQGRQFGRGFSGGQVRDDRRSKDEYDPGRGGFGKADSESQPNRNLFRQPYNARKRSRGDYLPSEKNKRASVSPDRLILEEENPRFRDRPELNAEPHEDMEKADVVMASNDEASQIKPELEESVKIE
ncbi:hypothetical protein ABG067_006026 [Albugo candida]